MKIEEYDSFEAFSWEIIGENIAIKTIDKSIFESRRTGIPTQIRFFWGIEDLNVGATKVIEVVWRGVTYSVTIERESYREPYRTKMKWNGKLAHDLAKAIPAELRDFKDHVHKMRFERLGVDKYLLDILYPEEDIFDENEEDSQSLLEGDTIESIAKTYRRNKRNRDNAIKIHGTRCYCCGFSFSDFYGDIGIGYVEIHHKQPLSERNEVRETNPEIDLVPLCSNCHRMIHRKKPAMNVEDLKALINDKHR